MLKWRSRIHAVAEIWSVGPQKQVLLCAKSTLQGIFDNECIDISEGKSEITNFIKLELRIKLHFGKQLPNPGILNYTIYGL